MTGRIAGAIFVSLVLLAALGWALPPEPATAEAELTSYPATTPADVDAALASLAALFTCMISGAATIGLVFFRPQTPRGPRVREALSVASELFVECARRGLTDLHQELEVVLRLLQAVDQQVDRLVRVETGQHAP